MTHEEILATLDVVKVLDHGWVRLVDFMGSDLSIVRSARVSYDAAWRAGDDPGSDSRLIRYLLRNRHTTPFESVEFQFEVKAPIFVFRQWHRHRTWSYNELSARYRELPEEFYVPSPHTIGTQSTSNKQVRDLTVPTPDVFERRLDQAAEVEDVCQELFTMYSRLIAEGWPRELARTILPLATYSHMFAKANLHNLLHFLTLRDHSHAQFEIRLYAQALHHLATKIVPVTMQHFKELQNVAE